MNEPSNEEEAAQLHREVVEELWTAPVFEACDSVLPRPHNATVMVAEARCGYAPLHLAEQLAEGTRIIACDPSRAMLDVARARVTEAVEGRIFFVPQRVNDISYADGVFQGAICLHGLVTNRQAAEGITELSRVAAKGGRIVVACPLAESFPEFYDLLDEALRDQEIAEVWPRVDAMRDSLITPARLVATARQVGLEDIEVERVSWSLSFEGGADFLHSPLVRETFFPHWIGCIRSSEREYVLRYIADAIDTYWHDRTFRCGVAAGVLVGRAD